MQIKPRRFVRCFLDYNRVLARMKGEGEIGSGASQTLLAGLQVPHTEHSGMAQCQEMTVRTEHIDARYRSVTRNKPASESCVLEPAKNDIRSMLDAGNHLKVRMHGVQ